MEEKKKTILLHILYICQQHLIPNNMRVNSTIALGLCNFLTYEVGILLLQMAHIETIKKWSLQYINF
jgi:hypothetical protein